MKHIKLSHNPEEITEIIIDLKVYKIGDIVNYNNQQFKIHRIFKSGKMDCRRVSDSACVFLLPKHIK